MSICGAFPKMHELKEFLSALKNVNSSMEFPLRQMIYQNRYNSVCRYKVSIRKEVSQRTVWLYLTVCMM